MNLTLDFYHGHQLFFIVSANYVGRWFKNVDSASLHLSGILIIISY